MISIQLFLRLYCRDTGYHLNAEGLHPMAFYNPIGNLLSEKIRVVGEA